MSSDRTESLIGSSKLFSSLSNALVQFPGNSLLFSQLAALLQPHRRLIRGDFENQLLRLPGEIGPLRDYSDDTDLAINPKPRGSHDEFRAVDRQPRRGRPFTMQIAQRLIKSISDSIRAV